MIPPEQRIREFMEEAEAALSCYLDSKGGSISAEPWYTILASGIDALFSLSIAASQLVTPAEPALTTALADLDNFLVQLLGPRDPGAIPYLQILGLPPR